MHHLANSMTKLCHGREKNSAGWEGVPLYGCSGEEAFFIMVEVGLCLYARGWMHFDSLRLGIKYACAGISTRS